MHLATKLISIMRDNADDAGGTAAIRLRGESRELRLSRDGVAAACAASAAVKTATDAVTMALAYVAAAGTLVTPVKNRIKYQPMCQVPSGG